MEYAKAIEIIVESIERGEVVPEAYDFSFWYAIQGAVQRCIPRIPVVFNAYPSDIVLCPRCKSTFVTRNGEVMNYCSNCGQRIRKEEKL